MGCFARAKPAMAAPLRASRPKPGELVRFRGAVIRSAAAATLRCSYRVD